jgi:hypothetical protein
MSALMLQARFPSLSIDWRPNDAVGPTQVAFTTDAVGGMIKLGDRRAKFAHTNRAETSSATNEPP